MLPSKIRDSRQTVGEHEGNLLSSYGFLESMLRDWNEIFACKWNKELAENPTSRYTYWFLLDRSWRDETIILGTIVGSIKSRKHGIQSRNARETRLRHDPGIDSLVFTYVSSAANSSCGLTTSIVATQTTFVVRSNCFGSETSRIV